MDRAWENLIARTAGATALALTLVHVGLEAPNKALPGLYLAPYVLGAVVAQWALARLNAKRPALWTATLLLGLVPTVMPLAHLPQLGQDVLYDGVLFAAVPFGLLTLVVGANALRVRRPVEDAPAAAKA